MRQAEQVGRILQMSEPETDPAWSVHRHTANGRDRTGGLSLDP